MDVEINYYDKVLAGITLSLLIGTSLGITTKMPVQYGVGSGAAISIGIMYHGMFRNGPLG